MIDFVRPMRDEACLPTGPELVAPHFTQFPTSIGLAATWDAAATQEMADIIRRQMPAVNQLQALSPVRDVARDARWGRVNETYGEDPYLMICVQQLR